MTNNEVIVRRVLDAVPARSYAMNALLSVLRIEVSTEVPTAAVSCTARPVLFINPEFVDRHCRSDEHLFMLVMHELHHVLLGHTRLFPRPTPAHNIAFDAVINAMLVARFPQQAYTSFFTDLYGEETGALRLLAPLGRRPPRSLTLAALHYMLYKSNSVTAEEVFRMITRHKSCAAADLGRLLGSHGADSDEWRRDGEMSADLVTALREIIEKWPPPDERRGGRSFGDILTRESIQPRNPRERVLAVLRHALCGAASRPGVRKAAVAGTQHVQTPLPQLRDRRATIVRSLGAQPLMNIGELPIGRRAAGRADIYLDVSGSVNEYLPPLYGALRALRDYVSPQVHLFSTKVKTVALEQVCQGHVTTTGGTDINCVLAHVAKTRPKKALIITDGYVGQGDHKQVASAAAACADIRVLLTPQGCRGDLAAIASRIDELPPLGDAR